MKFGSKALVPLGKRLYQKIWRGSESIALKLSKGIFNLFFGIIAAEKIEVKFFIFKKYRKCAKMCKNIKKFAQIEKFF